MGNRSSMVLPNGITNTYRYDSLNRLTNLTHQAGGTNLASYSYVLDATGRRTNATEVLWQDTGGYLTNKMTWQYDGMYRLTNEVKACSASGASYTDTYAYDLAGNRLMLIQNAGSAVTTTNVYDANDELVKEVTVSGGTATWHARRIHHRETPSCGGASPASPIFNSDFYWRKEMWVIERLGVTLTI